MTAICKFNKYCERLAELYNKSWNILLPQTLPTSLSSLRDNSNLMEDIWIAPFNEAVPPWLENVDVCKGIRAMLKID